MKGDPKWMQFGDYEVIDSGSCGVRRELHVHRADIFLQISNNWVLIKFTALFDNLSNTIFVVVLDYN
jgi:hypothetical protein